MGEHVLDPCPTRRCPACGFDMPHVSTVVILPDVVRLQIELTACAPCQKMAIRAAHRLEAALPVPSDIPQRTAAEWRHAMLTDFPEASLLVRLLSSGELVRDDPRFEWFDS